MKDLWNFQRSTQGKDSLKQSFSTVIWVSIRSKLYCVFNHLYKFCVIRGKNNCFILEKSFNFYGLFLVPKLNKVKQNRSNFYEINFCDFFVKQKILESFQSSGFLNTVVHLNVNKFFAAFIYESIISPTCTWRTSLVLVIGNRSSHPSTSLWWSQCLLLRLNSGSCLFACVYNGLLECPLQNGIIFVSNFIFTYYLRETV